MSIENKSPNQSSQISQINLSTGVKQLPSHVNSSIPTTGGANFKPNNSTSKLSIFKNIVYKIRSLRSTKAYNYCYLGLTIALIIALLLQQSDKTSIISLILQKVQYFCHCGFIMFVAIRLLSFQPIHVGWCIAQFLAFSSGISTLFVESKQLKVYLHALSCIRALIIVRTTSLYIPFINFVGAFKNVIKIVFPIVILIYLFSLVGLFAFSRSYENQCQLFLSSSTYWSYVEDISLCSINQCPAFLLNNSQLQCISYQNLKKSFQSSQNDLTNVGYQLLLYKNIFYSLYNNFKIVFIAGWSKIAILQKQKVNEVFVCLYYTIYLYLISFIYMDIFYGMMMVNQNQNIPSLEQKMLLNFKQQQNHIIVQEENKLDHKSQRKIEKSQVNKLRKSICLDPELKQNLLMVVIKPQQKSQQIGIFKYENNQQNLFKTLSTKKRISVLQKDYFLPQSQKYKTIMLNFLQIYKKIDLIFIFICCLNMCIQTEQISYKKCNARNIIDMICSLQLFLTFLLKMICYQIKQIKLANWCQRNHTNVPLNLQQYDVQLKFQIIIAACSGAGLYIQIFQDQINPFLSYPTNKLAKFLRCIKYIRICKILARLDHLEKCKKIFQSIIKVLEKILPYFGFYLLMLVLLSLISFNLFQYKDQKQFNYSFSQVINSIIFVFMIFCNDQQQAILLQQYPLQGIIVVVFHLVSLTIGFAILSKYFMTLFLTQLLNQLDVIHSRIQQNIKQNKQITQQNEQQTQLSVNLQNNKVANSYFQEASQSKNLKYIIKCQQQTNLQKNQEPFMNRLKNRGHQFFNSNYYLVIHTLITIISLSQVAILTPILDRNSSMYLNVKIVQQILAAYYFVQMFLEMFVFGVFHKQNSYFYRLKTNSIAFILALICITNLFPIAQNEILQKIYKLKILRMYVTLQLFCFKNINLKLTIIGFMRIIPKLAKFLLIVVSIYGFFGNLLVSSISNQFYFCVNSYSLQKVQTMKDCLIWGGDWINNTFNADYSTMAIINLIFTSLTQSWDHLITPITQIRGLNMQPKQNSNPQLYILCVFGYLIGSFIILNVFIGYSLYQMKRITDQQTGQSKLDKFQSNWLCIKQQIYRLVLYPKVQFQRGTIKYYCEIIINSNFYKALKIIYMCLFVISLSLLTSDTLKQKLLLIYKIIIIQAFSSMVFFCIQCIGRKKKHKIWLYCFHFIFYSYACVFSMFILKKQTINKENMVYCAILISLQLFQFWLYIIQFEFVHKTLKYVWIILPRASNILFLMCIVLLTYTFVAVQLFSYQRPSGNENQFLQNYTSFFNSLFSLIKFSTWQSSIEQIINSSHQQNPNFICFTINNYIDYLKFGQMGCGSKYKSYIFFGSFHIFYVMIMHSALLANIFDSYNEVKKQDYILSNLFQLQKVTTEWLKFDQKGQGFISFHNFWNLANKLYEIYGFSQKQSRTEQSKSQFLNHLNVKMYKKNGVFGFQFYVTIQYLVRLLLSRRQKRQPGPNKADALFQKINKKKQNFLEQTQFTSKDVFTIIVIRRGLTKWHKKSLNKKKTLVFKTVQKFLVGKFKTINKLKNQKQIQQSQQDQQQNNITH